MNTYDEIDAMKQIADVLEEFRGDSETQARIVQWVTARFGDPPSRDVAPPPDTSATPQVQGPEQDEGFEDVADLFDAAGPQTDADRALVVGYWLMDPEGKSDFTSREVNSELKNLGHGVSNITAAFSRLMKRRPALAMQTAKAGTSKQARKRYKLTRAGFKGVQAMIQAERESEE